MARKIWNKYLQLVLFSRFKLQTMHTNKVSYMRAFFKTISQTLSACFQCQGSGSGKKQVWMLFQLRSSSASDMGYSCNGNFILEIVAKKRNTLNCQCPEATGQQEKTCWSRQVHVCVCVCVYPTVHACLPQTNEGPIKSNILRLCLSSCRTGSQGGDWVYRATC